MTTDGDFAASVVVRRTRDRVEIGAIRDAGLNAAHQRVESYRSNGTRYLIVTTNPGVTKIHYSFFLYVNDHGRGALELRSLSGTLEIGYYDLACAEETLEVEADR